MANLTDTEAEKYFNSIVNTDKYKEIDEFIGISRYVGITKTEDLKRLLDELSMFERFKQYLEVFHPRSDTKKSFIPDFEYFKKFFENYKNPDYYNTYTEEGYIDLNNTLFLEQPPLFAKATGWFTDRYILFADGSISILKYPLSYKSAQSEVRDKDCIYCSIVGTGIAKAIGVDTSENTIAKRKDGWLRISSKNFLRHGEELITFLGEGRNLYVSEILEQLDRVEVLRNYPMKEINQVKLDYLKQEFLAKLIGLKDQKADNTGLVTSMGKNGRHVRIAPMFDYDYSFFIGEKVDLSVNKCDNGREDIASLIIQYKDYPGFINFVKSAVSSLDMNKVYRGIYKDTGLSIFQNPENNTTLKRFSDFVESNLDKARFALDQLFPNERGEK